MWVSDSTQTNCNFIGDNGVLRMHKLINPYVDRWNDTTIFVNHMDLLDCPDGFLMANVTLIRQLRSNGGYIKMERSMQISDLKLAKFGCDPSCQALETGDAKGECDKTKGGCLTCSRSEYLDTTSTPALCKQKCANNSYIKFSTYDSNYGIKNLSHKTCVIECGEGYYLKAGTILCDICDPYCLNCSGPNPNQCLSCKTDKYHFESSCYEECPRNTQTNEQAKTCIGGSGLSSDSIIGINSNPISPDSYVENDPSLSATIYYKYANATNLTIEWELRGYSFDDFTLDNIFGSSLMRKKSNVHLNLADLTSEVRDNLKAYVTVSDGLVSSEAYLDLNFRKPTDMFVLESSSP